MLLLHGRIGPLLHISLKEQLNSLRDMEALCKTSTSQAVQCNLCFKVTKVSILAVRKGELLLYLHLFSSYFVKIRYIDAVTIKHLNIFRSTPAAKVLTFPQPSPNLRFWKAAVRY